MQLFWKYSSSVQLIVIKSCLMFYVALREILRGTVSVILEEPLYFQYFSILGIFFPWNQSIIIFVVTKLIRFSKLGSEFGIKVIFIVWSFRDESNHSVYNEFLFKKILFWNFLYLLRSAVILILNIYDHLFMLLFYQLIRFLLLFFNYFIKHLNIYWMFGVRFL